MGKTITACPQLDEALLVLNDASTEGMRFHVFDMIERSDFIANKHQRAVSSKPTTRLRRSLRSSA